MLISTFRSHSPAIFLSWLLVLISFCHAQSPQTSTKVVRYEDYGAVGDGKTDDFAALAKAHRHANEQDITVRARDGANYYLGGADRTILIQTDTDFGSARFIIDDTKLEDHRSQIFTVVSKHQPIWLPTIKSLSKGQRRIDVKLPQPGLVVISDSTTKRFIRRGKNRNGGSSQTEVLLVDTNGVVDSKSPIVWDYKRVTEAYCLPIDEKLLTLRGGTFTTIANNRRSSAYHRRGILIRRSNVVIDGIKHFVQGEGETGPPYTGFLCVSRCSNITIKNSVFTGRKAYSKTNSAGESVNMGSYDINLDRAVNVALINCSQSNDIMDATRWGIMGSNFCKNLIFDRCSLSRFDAHQGVTNGAIRNSTIGHMGIKLIGGGHFEVENTTVKDREFVELRSDYGSTWNGDIIIVNSRLEPPPGNYTPSVLGGWNDGQHDFGYPCHLPTRIKLDGFHIEDVEHEENTMGPSIFADFNPKFLSESDEPPHHPIITREVELRRVSTASGKPLRISSNPHMFEGIKIKGD